MRYVEIFNPVVADSESFAVASIKKLVICGKRKRHRMNNLNRRKEMWRFAETILPDAAVLVIAVEESIQMMSNMFLCSMRYVGIFKIVGADTENDAGASMLQLRLKVRTLMSKKFQKLSNHRMYETRYEELKYKYMLIIKTKPFTNRTARLEELDQRTTTRG
eukprot:TRINITY_DN3034_c0_g1_i1.p2 TRINITY_DN3034_c0_g1~~TRINITY_DN3034_c0_g1_i1.p2  ORF type:complete len:162 (-),score=16.57 TRINITY_DN3034_c0_g1_i1:4-489(-)